MSIRHCLTTKLFSLSTVVLIEMMLGACSKPNETSEVKNASFAMDQTRPTKIAKAYFYGGGRCEIDSSNPPAISGRISTSRKLPFTLSGWTATDSTRNPAPPLIFAVLSNDKNSFYLEGKRVPRPDVAAALGNRLLDFAGYEVLGNLSNIPAGEYKLSFASGTEFVVEVCQTRTVVRVTE